MATKATLQTAYGHLPLSFEANQGQSDAQVQFLAHGRGYSLFLTPSEAVLTLRQKPGARSQNLTPSPLLSYACSSWGPVPALT